MSRFQIDGVGNTSCASSRGDRWGDRHDRAIQSADDGEFRAREGLEHVCIHIGVLVAQHDVPRAENIGGQAKENIATFDRAADSVYRDLLIGRHMNSQVSDSIGIEAQVGFERNIDDGFLAGYDAECLCEF